MIAPSPADYRTYDAWVEAYLTFVARRWSRESVTQTIRRRHMEAFLRDMIDRVEAQIGPIQAEYAAYVELRDSLKKLAKLGAELRQEQLVSKPNGKPKPEERVTLRERILEVMEDRTPRTLDQIVGACQRLGWVTKSTNPKQVAYEQVKKLVSERELKRTGRPRSYRYQSAT